MFVFEQLQVPSVKTVPEKFVTEWDPERLLFFRPGLLLFTLFFQTIARGRKSKMGRKCRKCKFHILWKR